MWSGQHGKLLSIPGQFRTSKRGRQSHEQCGLSLSCRLLHALHSLSPALSLLSRTSQPRGGRVKIWYGLKQIFLSLFTFSMSKRDREKKGDRDRARVFTCDTPSSWAQVCPVCPGMAQTRNENLPLWVCFAFTTVPPSSTPIHFLVCLCFSYTAGFFLFHSLLRIVGHAHTWTWDAFQAAESGVQILQLAMWDPAAVTTMPLAGPR